MAIIIILCTSAPGSTPAQQSRACAENAGLSFFWCMPMRVRRIAVLIDGAFFLKRLSKLIEPQFCTTPQQVAETARLMCKRHILRLTHMEATQDAEGEWLDHLYRLFYYDAEPFDGFVHHPVLNRRIEFGKSE